VTRDTHLRRQSIVYRNLIECRPSQPTPPHTDHHIHDSPVGHPNSCAIYQFGAVDNVYGSRPSSWCKFGVQRADGHRLAS
jgi:hypothetical protein